MLVYGHKGRLFRGAICSAYPGIRHAYFQRSEAATSFAEAGRLSCRCHAAALSPMDDQPGEATSVDFGLSENDRMILDTARQFVARELDPLLPQVQAADLEGRAFPDGEALEDLQARAREAGFR